MRKTRMIFCVLMLATACARNDSPAPSLRNSPGSNGIGGQQEQGWDVGNGGDSYAGEFVQLAREMAKIVHYRALTQIPVSQFDDAVDRTLVVSKSSIEIPETRHGSVERRPLDALNFPRETPPRIEVSRAAWDRMKGSRSDRIALVIHEYLSIMGIDDKRYQISRNLDVPELFDRLVLPTEETGQTLVEKCHALPSARDAWVYAKDISRSVPTELVVPAGKETVILCLAAPNEGQEMRRLPIGELSFRSDFSRLFLFGVGLDRLPARFFSQMETVERLTIVGIGDLRPSQYLEIDQMKKLTHVFFQDAFFSSPLRRLGAFDKGSQTMLQFNCQAGQSAPWEALGSVPGILCARKPAWPQVYESLPLE